MFHIPSSTFVNKKIPKQRFYDHLDVSSFLKRTFIDKVESIYWKNKIATTTTNLAKGKEVVEIEVFEVTLTNPNVSNDFFKLIDKGIPYHIVFTLKHEDKVKYVISFKEKSLGNSPYKVGDYYSTDWCKDEDITLSLQGLNLDEVYENFVRQIAGSSLNKSQEDEDLKTSVEKDNKRQLLEKQITQLKNKIAKEKQFNKQVEMNKQLKELQQQLNGI